MKPVKVTSHDRTHPQIFAVYCGLYEAWRRGLIRVTEQYAGDEFQQVAALIVREIKKQEKKRKGRK